MATHAQERQRISGLLAGLPILTPLRSQNLVYEHGHSMKDGKTYVLAWMKDGTLNIYRLDGTERGLSAGNIWVEFVRSYKRESNAKFFFRSLL